MSLSSTFQPRLSPMSGFRMLASLPTGLLDYLLTTSYLTAFDLTSLYHAAALDHPILAEAIECAAFTILRQSAHGRFLLANPLSTETPLSALRFLHSLDSPAPLRSYTSVWSCGRNDWGQGARPINADVNELHPCYRIPSDDFEFTRPPSIIVSIAAGSVHSACLTAAGALLVIGANTRGQLGLGDSSSRSAWIHVFDFKGVRIVQIACGDAHTAILTASGTVFTTGANSFGQLGLGNRKDRQRFQPIPSISTVAMVTTGRSHTVCLMRDGSVFAAGDNSNGQLGGRSGAGSDSLRPIGCFGHRIVRVASGVDTTMMLTADNMVLVTGKRQCGLSVIGGLGSSRVSHFAVGDRFAVVRTRRGDVAMSMHRKRFKVSDEFLHVSASAVTAGDSHYAITCEDGSVLAAGANAFGQVAAGQMGLTVEGSPNARVIRTHKVSLSPVKIPAGYEVLQIAAGAFHTLYLLSKKN